MKGKQPQEAALIEQIQNAEEIGEGKELARNLNNDKDMIETKLKNKQFDIES